MASSEGRVDVVAQKSSPVVYASRGKSTPPVFATKGRSFPFSTEESPETASNLLTFRMLFGDDNGETEEKEEFRGFEKKDELRKKCKLARDGIAQEICKMEKQIRKAKLELKRKSMPVDEQTKKLKLETSEPVCDNIAAESVPGDSSVAPLDKPRIEILEDKEDSRASVKASSDKPRKQVFLPRKAKEIYTSSESRISSPVITRSLNVKNSLPKDGSMNGLPVEKALGGEENLLVITASSAATKVSEVPTRKSFIGFPLDSPLLLACKRKLESITMELEKEDDFLGFPQDHPLRQKCIMRLVKLKAEINSNANFIGFSGNDPLLKSVFGKYKAIASELSTVIDSIKVKRESALKVLSPSQPKPLQIFKTAKEIKQIISNDTESEAVQSSTNEEKTFVASPTAAGSRLRNSGGATSVPKKEYDHDSSARSRKQVKVLHPNVKANIKHVRLGPRIKNVRFCGGPGQTLPLSKFLPNQYPWNQDYGESAATSEETAKEVLVDLSSEPAFRCDSGVDEEILLGRQRGTLGNRSGLLNAIIPSSMEEIANSGFPVVVTQPLPPKPLCFLCGSAGITQLIFCSVCCEPYHPYCAGDDSLMASFVVLACLSNQNGATVVGVQHNVGSKGNAGLRGTAVASDEQPLKEEALKLQDKLISWTCNRCTICSACGKYRRDNGKNKTKLVEEKFVKCSSCKDTYHTQCLGKRLADGFIEDFDPPASVDENEQQWMCENCAKCRSCGVKLDFQEKKKKRNNLMLCMECFKRRQRGSFCPVCNVTYDDNDYETRMMECGECQRWIHAKCEGVSEEQYQILSILDNVEFVCKLCDKTGCPLWLQAVRSEIVNGCESALRSFVKKALRETRKRRALSFDDILLLPIDDSAESMSNNVSKISKSSELVEVNPHQEKDVVDFVDARVMKIASKNDCVTAGISSTVRPKIHDDRKNGNAGVIVEFKSACSRTIRRSRRKKVTDNCSNSGKISPNLQPVQVYETSDGNLVSIRECKVILQDVLKDSASAVSKYPAEVKKLTAGKRIMVDSPNSSLNLSSGTDAFEPLGDVPEFYHRETLEATPKKLNSLVTCVGKTPIGSTPHVPFTPSRKVADFADLVKKHVIVEATPSVMYFQQESLLILDDYFDEEEDNRRKQLHDEFLMAVKEVFSWFDPQAIIKSDLPKFQPRVSFDMGQRLPESPADTDATIHTTCPFKDTFWSKNVEDKRICSFCGNCGDLTPNGCGRLLWAGVSEWIHVNCALWSSEVWEEETGALQQVGVALSRSRNTRCDHCNKTGASVSCCQNSCRKSYHFPCSLMAKCSLKLDKTVFCVFHSGDITRSSLQLEYQVQRKVFVDLDYIKKKEKPVLSSQIRVFIGSLKIETLGDIVQTSVYPDPAYDLERRGHGTILIPNEYHCKRLYWSHVDPFEKCTYELSGSVRKDWFRNFVQNNSHVDFNIVIDHSEPHHVMREKLLQMNTFHDWIRTAPKLIDEFNVEWIPKLPETLYYGEEPVLEECCEVVCQACNEQNICQEYSRIHNEELFLHWEQFRDEIKLSNKLPVNDEPLELDEYLWLYERLKDISGLLDEDLQSLDKSVGVDCRVNIFNQPEGLNIEFRPKNFAETLIENLGIQSELHAGDPEFKKMLMYSMLDGAVNDSSSDSSSSNSSSSSSSSSDQEMDDAVSTSASTSTSASSSEDEVAKDLTKTGTTPRRLTRIQTQIKKTGSNLVPTHPSGRLLRRRERKPVILCKSCKKVFPTKASLSKHGRSCRLKNQSKEVGKSGKAKEPQARSESHDRLQGSSLPPPSRTKRNRGRPPKKIKAELPETTVEVANKRTTRQRNNPTKVQNSVRVERVEANVRKQPVTRSSTAEDSPSSSDEESKSCAKCKLVYKTVESLKKHLASGNCISSDEDEGTEGDVRVPAQAPALLSHEVDVTCSRVPTQNESLIENKALVITTEFSEKNFTSMEMSDNSTTSSSTSDGVDDECIEAMTDPIESESSSPLECSPKYFGATECGSQAEPERFSEKTPKPACILETPEKSSSVLRSLGPEDQAHEFGDEIHNNGDKDYEQLQEVEEISAAGSTEVEVIDVVVAPAVVQPEEVRHTSENNSNQFFQPSESTGGFFRSYPDAGSLSESRTMSFQPFDSNCPNNMPNVIQQPTLADMMNPEKVGQEGRFGSTGFTHCNPVFSGMNIPGQSVAFDNTSVLRMHTRALQHPESSSSQFGSANVELSPMNIDCRMSGLLRESLMAGCDSYTTNSMNYSGIPAPQNSGDHFISMGNSHAVGIQPQFQQQIDSIQPMHLPLGYGPVQETNYQQHSVDYQGLASSSNKIFSWPISDSSQPQIIVNPSSLHQFQQQYDSQGPVQNQVRIPQYHYGGGPSPSPAQIHSLQQMGICSPSVVQEATGNSSNITQGLPVYGSVRQGQSGSDGNVALIVLQHGNTFSTVPVNQSAPFHTHGLHQAHSNLGLSEHQRVQQNVCMIMNSRSAPPPPPAPQISVCPSDQPIHNLSSQSVESPYCLQRDVPINRSSTSPHQIYSCVRSCSCGKHHEDQCTSGSIVPVGTMQVSQADMSGCCVVSAPKQHMRSAKPIKHTIRQNKPITLRPAESFQSNILPPLFTSPNKRDVCHTNLGGVASPASAAPSLESASLGKVPMSSPNIAVVRPMENPLQKMSNQVAQIEVNFNNPSPGGPAQNQAEVATRFEIPSFASRGAFDAVNESVYPAPNESFCKDTRAVPDSGSKYEDIDQATVCDQYCKPEQVEGAIPQSKEIHDPERSCKPEGDSKGKSIKVTLKRKEGGDSYSINDITETGVESSGAMRSLKIKAKITSGEHAGTATDVVVTPVIQTIPIVSELKTTNGQHSSIGYDEKQGLVCTVSVPDQDDKGSDFDPHCNLRPPLPPSGETLKQTRRLTHRAVIVYEVKCNDTVLFRSSDVRAVWGHIFEVVQGTRLKQKLPPLPYPATNISLPENRREAANSFNMLGLTHQAVQFLLEQLPGTNSVMEKHKFKFHHPKIEDTLPPANATGCARTQPFVSRKPFDMFGWLASKHRTVPTTLETSTDHAIQDLPIAMRYRNLREKSSGTLGVFYSAIHGRGLFTRRDIQEGEMIIEYAGELIRTILSDLKERYYESKGIGCYFFKIDEKVIIDATMKGNAARFINHSCEPNCKSKAVDILGKKHILIFAERKIFAGEELTYDYKFALEDIDKKIPCTCGARKCRKYLN